MESYEEAAQYSHIELKRWQKCPEGSPPEKPEKPVCTRYLVNDVTTEALAPLLQQNHSGVLLGRDELSGWLTGFDAYKNSQGADVARWLEIWDGGSYTIDRKSDDGPIYVPHAAVSIAGGIQPGIFKRIMTTRYFESGMVQRLLWARPPVSSQKWTSVEISAELDHQMERLFKRLTGLEMEQTDTGPKPVVIPVSGKGLDIWIPWYNDLGRRITKQQQADNPFLASAWSKLHIYAARLALLHHLVERPDEPEVGAEAFTAAIALAEWFAHEAERLYAVMAADRDDTELIEVAEFVHRKGGRLSVRDLTHSWRRYRDDRDGAEQVLQRLVETGWGRWDTKTTSKGGRPKTEFILSDVTETSKTPEKSEVSVTPQNLPVTESPRNTEKSEVSVTRSGSEKSWPEDAPRPVLNSETGMEELAL
jgi:hypothetical protein